MMITNTQQNKQIDLEQLKKKTVHLAIFGHGNVGSKLIEQIQISKKGISARRNVNLVVFAIANSKKVLLSTSNFNADWKWHIAQNGSAYTIDDIIDFAKEHQLDNLIAIDNTASKTLVAQYPKLIANGFNLVSSNKIGNTIGLDFYNQTRSILADNNKEYLYETNVGAGLPLVDTIKLLHLSGENITRIKGVFSGSLSYIFNTFSEKEEKFSTILKNAINNGLTEPDPREDLCGNDVGRKLLILARELELYNEFEDVSIENLIPKRLRKTSKENFFKNLKDFDVPFQIKKKNQDKNHVLRYVGDLHGDLSKSNGGILTVKLVSVPKNSMLGQLKDADSIFEIYTESYGKNPIIIQGAGAGAAVTARGVFGDILRLSDKLN